MRVARTVAAGLLVTGCSLSTVGLLGPSDGGATDATVAGGAMPEDGGSDGRRPDAAHSDARMGADARGDHDAGARSDADAGFHDAEGGTDVGRPDTGCDASLLDDPMNCGTCGHDCGGGTCMAGGCQPYDLVTVATGKTVRAVAVDSAHLYWSNTTDLTIVEANVDGTSPTSFLTGVNATEIAVDATALYYTDGALHMVPFATRTDRMVASGPQGCVWPVSASEAYCAQFGASKFLAVDLDSGSVMTLYSGTDGVFQPWGVAATAAAFYWTSSGVGLDGSIMRRPLPSGTAVAVRTGLANPNCLSFDEAGLLYWPNYDEGSIHRSHADGTSDTIVATGQVHPTIVAIDAKYLYWNSGNSVERLAR